MLTNKTTIITGATKGIGRSIATLFAKQNAQVYAIGRDTDSLNSFADLSANIHPIESDIRDLSTMKTVFQQIKKEQGGIDVLINNAGIMKDALIGMINDEMLTDVFSTNVFALIQLSQLASRFMSRQNSGSIINLASIIGIEGNPGQSVYAASKGAVISFTKAAAKELAPKGIRVNAIAPGIIQTNLLKDVPENKLAERVQKIQMGRIGQPEDVAQTALYLASDLSSYVTGQIIKVDGATIL